jgi:hypothetical protein
MPVIQAGNSNSAILDEPPKAFRSHSYARVKYKIPSIFMPYCLVKTMRGEPIKVIHVCGLHLGIGNIGGAAND